ncbi:MAG: glycosyltransferase family 9 protein [Planctomycetota bacterium]
MKKVIIMRPGALGDVLLLRPALYKSKKEIPNFFLTVLAPGSRGQLLLQEGFADQVINLEARESLWIFSSELTPDKVTAARVKDADIVICFCNEDKVIRNSFLSCGAGKVFFYKDRPEENSRIHTAQYLWQCIAHSAGLSVDKIEYSEIPGFASESIFDASSFLADMGLLKDNYFVIHPGSGSMKKNADLRYFVDFADQNIHNQIVVIGGEADGGLAEKLQEMLPKVKIMAPLTLQELQVILTNSSGYLGNDSGVSHLAGQSGAEVNVFFKVTDPERWAPVGRSVNIIYV